MLGAFSRKKEERGEERGEEREEIIRPIGVAARCRRTRGADGAPRAGRFATEGGLPLWDRPYH